MIRARLCAVSAALALLLAAPADARKFQLSGSWFERRGQVFFPPLQFAATPMTPGMNHLSMGNLTGAYGFPHGPILGEGGVTATGSAPATLRIPAHRFVEDTMALVVLSGINLLQLTTQIGIDAPFVTGTLAPGGGPGSFTWCPGDPGCVAGGGMLSTDWPQGAGRQGRVIYRAGANRFGGAMELGLRRGGVISVVFGTGLPLRAAHVRFEASGSTLRPNALGGAGSADAPLKRMDYLRPGFVTQPTMAPAMGSPILFPGPKVNTMFTTYGPYPVYYLPTIAMGPMGTPAGQFTTSYGFAHTTGTVIAQQAVGTGGFDFFTAMGSDARTPLGAGNLSLVAGGLSFRNTLSSPTGTPYGTFAKVTLTLAPPIPSLSPAGVAAAGALVLLGAGYALRGRLAAPRRRGRCRERTRGCSSARSTRPSGW